MADNNEIDWLMRMAAIEDASDSISARGDSQERSEVIQNPGSDALQLWFGLSYASFAVLPRVLMQEMPDEWQARMTRCLEEVDAMFPNAPQVRYRVSALDDSGRLVRIPDVFRDYRHTRRADIDAMREAGALP